MKSSAWVVGLIPVAGVVTFAFGAAATRAQLPAADTGEVVSEPTVVVLQAEPVEAPRVVLSRPARTSRVSADRREPTPSAARSTPRTSRARTSRTRSESATRRSTPRRTSSRRVTPTSRWEAPSGPIRIGLQAGHWRADEAPRELRGLRENGTAWRNTAEWEVNLDIVRRAASMLEDLGYEVDVLPAVVPPGYRAHLFVAVHADGANDPAASGYRVASPYRDATGMASQMADLLKDTYGEATGLRRLESVTRRMRSYYAFNYRRYHHALHPQTIGVILETGFLTSPRDRGIILSDPDRSARGIVEAIKAFPVTSLERVEEQAFGRNP